MHRSHVQKTVMHYHRLISHEVLKQASRDASFKRRLISLVTQLNTLAPLLASITLAQFRGLVEDDRGVYAFRDTLPHPDGQFWVHIKQIESAQGTIDVYYHASAVELGLDDTTAVVLRDLYSRLYQWQCILSDDDIHPITLAMVVTQIQRANPLLQLQKAQHGSI